MTEKIELIEPDEQFSGINNDVIIIRMMARNYKEDEINFIERFYDIKKDTSSEHHSSKYMNVIGDDPFYFF